MFFYLSKFAWFIVAPGNLIFLGLLLGVILLWTRWRRSGVYILSVTTLLSLLIATVPVGAYAVNIFEDRFQKPYLANKNVDGIIVLGGVISPALSVSRKELSFGSATERLVAFAQLSKNHPNAKLVFTGGTGDPFNPDLSEAKMVQPLLVELGMDLKRIAFETESRNTVENAEMTFSMLKPQVGENWILITSAFHMPRAVGCFRKVGWDIIPYPVDYGTMSGSDIPPLQFNFTQGLSNLNAATHEALGLLMYFVTGKTDALFPSPTASL